jgi:hypothetical protein
MLAQWSKYDDTVKAKMATLQTLCTRSAVVNVTSVFEEFSTTQCAFNIIKVLLKTSTPLPIGSVITVTGLNGEPINGSVIREQGSSRALSGWTWTPPICLDWCSKSGLCPKTGSARDNSCLARSTAAVGFVTGKRCMRWCDSDADLTVTLNETYTGDLLLAVKVLNPPFQQEINALKLSITGPGVFAPATTISPKDKYYGKGVLSARSSPIFSTFEIGEDGCDGKLENETGIWRGSCAGMLNTISITLQSNLELFSGTILEITGLVRSGTGWPPPSIRAKDSNGASLFTKFSIDDWRSDIGAIKMRVLEDESGANSAMMIPGEKVVIGLEFLMPSIVDGDKIVKPPIRISVERAGYNRECSFESEWTNAQVLVAKKTSTSSLSTFISSATCNPGECNEIQVTIVSNKALQSTAGITIAITGLEGMNISDKCNPRANCAEETNDIELFDAIDGSNHRNLFQSTSVNTAKLGTAMWDSFKKHLVFRLAKGVQIDAYKEYAISFRLQNGFVGVDLSSKIKISAMMSSGECFAGLTNQADGTCDATAQRMFQKSPVKVCAPGFNVRKIGQTFPWPGCDGQSNIVTVTLQPNVRIDTGSLIRLKRFFGPKDFTKGPRCVRQTAQTLISECSVSSETFYPTGSCSVSARIGNCTCSANGDASCSVMNPCINPNITNVTNASNVSTGNCSNVTTSTCLCMISAVKMRTAQSHNVTFLWHDLASQIDLTVLPDNALLPDKTYQFSFNVMNPANEQLEPAITVEVVDSNSKFSIDPAALAHDVTTIPVVGRSLAGDAAALNILTAQFLVKNIGQSNPYPSVKNRITVTLISNIALGSEKDESGNVTIPGTITISGLVGFEDSDMRNLKISQISPSNVILSTNGTWTKDTGRLVLSVQNKWRAGEDAIIFSFEMKNPGYCHASPDISVSAQSLGTDCSTTIPFTPMLRDGQSIPFANCRACGGVKDAGCEACRRCDQRCDNQDAHPLKVHAPAFVIKQIGHSTTWPGSNNTISVTFATNIELTQDAAIFISGFVGGSAPNGSITIRSNSTCLQTAEWNNDEKLIYIKVDSPGTKPDSTTYSFTFQLRNALTSQRAPLLKIWAINAGTCKAPVPKCSMDRPASYTMQPLHIDDCGFLLKYIGHSSPFVSAVNTITATLSMNCVLQRPAKVTIMGIMGKASPCNLAMPVESVNGKLFETTGVWFQGTGSLVLTTAQNTVAVPGTAYVISFSVVNPPTAQNSPLVSVVADGTDGVLMNVVSMEVTPPKIVTARIGQSSASPSSRNLMTVTLRTNAPIHSESSGAFTISGLVGVVARTGPIALRNGIVRCFDNAVNCTAEPGNTCCKQDSISIFKGSRDGVPGTGWWHGGSSDSKAPAGNDEDDGWVDRGPLHTPAHSLVLIVAGTMSESREYVFSFDTFNGKCQLKCPAATLITNGLEFAPASCGAEACKAAFMPMDVPRSMPIIQAIGAACAGKVYAPLFNIKTISECSTVNSSPNTFTVTLSSNVYLIKGTVISISGLLSNSGMQEDVTLSGRDAALFEAKWTQATGVLLIQVRNDPGIAIDQEIVFSFMLFNSPWKQAQVQASVGAESSEMIIGESTMSGLVLGAGSFPTFTVADIAESSTVQQSYNTLMMVFQSNARIPENSVMRITGLEGSAATAASQYKLSGMHSYYFNQTAIKWSEATGTLEFRTVNAVPSNIISMFAFEVLNSKEDQPPKTPSISVSCPSEVVGCPVNGFFIPDVRMCTNDDIKIGVCPSEFRMTGSVLSSTTPGEFMVRRIGQRTSYPGESNTLMLTLASSIEYRMSNFQKVVVVISGLEGARAQQGPMELAGAHPFTSGCWECTCESPWTCSAWTPSDASSVTFHLAADMSAGRSYSVAFDIVNPSGAGGQPSPAVLISIFLNDSPLSLPSGVLMVKDADTILQQVHESKAGEALPLFVRPAMFLRREIAQTLSYPCVTQFVCATLVPSTPLSVQKKSYFILESFEGAIVPNGEIALYKSSTTVDGDSTVPILQSSFENGNRSKGFWNMKSLSISVSCRIEAGTQISFCFQVTNPSTAQGGPDRMTIYSSDGDLFQDLVFSSKFLDLPYPMMKDSRPMYIRSAEFKMLNIEQSSPFPCDQNTIQVSFKTNVPLMTSCNAAISAKGLVGSTSLSSEAFELVAFSNNTFGSRAQWRNDGLLVIKIYNNTEAGLMYKAGVVLKNQNKGQVAQTVSVASSGVYIDWTTAEDDASKVPEKVMSLLCRWKTPEDALNCGKEDARPLKIYDPEFLVASVKQSTPWPGATNEVLVAFAANIDLNGDLQSNISISNMMGLHSEMPVAPFVIGDVRKGVFCDQDPNQTSNLFVMFSAQNVHERFTNMNPNNAENFVCVKAQYIFTNRTYSSILTTRNQLSLKKLSNSSNSSNLSNSSNPSNSSNLSNSSDTTTSTTSVLTNTSEWSVSSTEWLYFDGNTWRTMLPVPTDLLVGNISTFQGVRSMQPVKKHAQIAGIAAGFDNERSDIIFTRGNDRNVMISGDFLTPPHVAITSKEGSTQTILCQSSSGAIANISCSTTFNFIGKSAKITIDVLNLDSNDVTILAGGLSLPKSTGGVKICNKWARIVDGVAVPEGTLTYFDKFDGTGQLRITVNTTSVVSSTECKNKILYAKISVETPAWDLFGPQRADPKERVWNDWPLGTANPAGTTPWIEPSNTNLVGTGSFLVAKDANGIYGNTLRLEMRKGKSLSLGQRLSFSFFVLNSLSEKAPYQIFLRAESNCANIADTPMQGFLQVVMPSFILAQVVQSSPFPCSFNTITLAIISNVHLRGVDNAEFVIAGFHGATASDGSLDLSDSSAGAKHHEIFTATWKQSSRQVNFNVIKNMIGGRKYLFSFELDNPVVTIDSSSSIAGTPSDYEGLSRTSLWDSPVVTTSTKTFSASLHRSASAPTVPSFSAGVTSVQTTLGLCGNAYEGDAAVLYMYKPTFTVANISQSSALPCDTSTISVTIRSNVPLCAKDCFAQITISNLNGAIADDGAMQLSSVNEEEKHTFAATQKGTPGFGRWRQADQSLTLYLSCCMICNKDYRISFVVKNPSCFQPAPTVFIEATNQENKVAISKMQMKTSIKKLQLVGTEETLAIIAPSFTAALIGQSSSAACDRNLIMVTLGANVPLDIGKRITISGITNTMTNSTRTLAINSTVGPSNVACLNTTGVWDNEKGELVVQVEGSTIGGTNGSTYGTCYENTTWVDFYGNGCADYRSNGTWCDGAEERIKPIMNVSAHLRFNHLGRSAREECCACGWPRRGELWGCAFSFTVSNPAKELEGVVPSVTSTICRDCALTNNLMKGKVMIVGKLELDGNIWQSSPFPCDSNTITVSIRTRRMPLLSLCNPTITITNLNNAINIFNNDGNVSIREIASGSTMNGKWSTVVQDTVGSVSTISLKLSEFSTASLFHFSFVVINPNFAQVAPDIQIVSSIQDNRQLEKSVTGNFQRMPATSIYQPRRTVYDFTVGQNGRPVPFQTIANSSSLSEMIKNESGVLLSGAISPVDFSGLAEADWWFTCRNTEPDVVGGACVKFPDDGDDRKTLFVRKIFFTKSRIGQSNADACSHVTITVTLETSVPLLTRCRPAITLTGLREAVALQEAAVNESFFERGLNVTSFREVLREVNASDFAHNGNVSNLFVMHSFDRVAGTMVLRVANNTLAGKDYIITFKLRHRAQASDGVDVGLSMQYSASNLGPDQVYGYKFESPAWVLMPESGDTKPMKVKR